MEKVSELVNLSSIGQSLTSEDIRDMEKATKKDIVSFRKKFNHVISRLDKLDAKNVRKCKQRIIF